MSVADEKYRVFQEAFEEWQRTQEKTYEIEKMKIGAVLSEYFEAKMAEQRALAALEKLEEAYVKHLEQIKEKTL